MIRKVNFTKYTLFVLYFLSTLSACGGGSNTDLPNTVGQDTKAPIIKLVKPKPGSKSVDINSFIEIEFNETIVGYDTNNVLIQYYENLNGSVSMGTVNLNSNDFSFNQNILTIKPGLLRQGTKYQVAIKNFKDLANNKMQGQCEWEFATLPLYQGTVNTSTGNCGKSSMPPQTISSHQGGNYDKALLITLTCIDSVGEACANIYYTLDNTTPSENSLIYSGPISIAKINTTTILKYYGVDVAGIEEGFNSQIYTINSDTQGPVTSSDLPSGIYNSIQTVSLKCTLSVGLSCANIYYTLDGSTPSLTSSVYSGSISIENLNATTVLKYFGIDNAGRSETVKSQTYTIDTIPPKTTSNQVSGSYVGSINVTLNCTDSLTNSGCKNTYYTIDGSVPSELSILYTSTPIIINSSTVLRFFSIDNANNNELATINSLKFDIYIEATGFNGGAYGGSILSMATDPNNSAIVYSGIVQGGIYKSNTVNNQPNWTFKGFIGENVNSILTHPTNSSIMFISTNVGFYKTIDAGLNWELLVSGYSSIIKIDPVVPDTLYIIVSNSLMRSTDGGTSFVQLNTSGNIYGITIDTLSTTMYVATHLGLYKSINQGDTWSLTQSVIFTDSFFKDVDIDPNNASVIYATSDNIYKSIDAGVTWSVFKIKQNSLLHFTIHPANSNILFYSNGSSLHKSSDAGKTWTIPLSVFNLRVLIFDQLDSNTMYAGFDNEGIYRSLDSGATWNQWNDGLTATTIKALGLDPVSSQTLFVATGTKTIVLKSINGGISWLANNYSRTFLNTRISDITFDPNNANNIYISDTWTGINKTTDGGVTWKILNFDLPSVGTYSKSMIFDNKNTGILYAHVISNSLNEESVYKSIDNGISWLKSSVGLPVKLTHNSLTIDPVNTDTLYVVNSDLNTGDLFKSTDAGLTWIGLGTGINNILSIAIDPNTPKELYLGTSDGKIFKTLNNGALWTPTIVDNGLDTIKQSITVLEVSHLNSNIIYAGTNGSGLFRSSNYGKDWIRINVSNMNSNIINIIRIDFNNDDIIYVGTSSGSVWKVVVTP